MALSLPHKLSSKRLHEDDGGAVLVEFSLVAALMLLITFSLVEFGLVYNKFNSAQKATQAAARIAATRLILEGVSDCGVATSASAGTDCANIPGSTGWSVVCTGAGGSGCNMTGINAVLASVAAIYPDAEPADVRITFSGTGYGFVGRGKPVPAITVSIENITYDFVAVGGLLNALTPGTTFAASIGIDSAQTTVIGEDTGDGTS